jgi:hypothetical protein
MSSDKTADCGSPPDIEIVMKFMRDYQIVRQPMRLVDATVRKRAAPECRYVG